MGKRQEVEALRVSFVLLVVVQPGPPEGNDAGLLGMELQPEAGEPLPEHLQYPLSVSPELEAHDEVVTILCTFCGVTVSCLPCFAQPYRFVNHTTLEAFVKGEYQRRDVQVRWDLLHSYLHRFAEWQPELLKIIGHRFGRASPEEDATAFWRRAVATCGSASELTVHLVEQSGTTCFGTYRCHQASFAQ